ncbi:MAG: AAA family ATPase [Syntrophobacteraceae bacterium]
MEPFEFTLLKSFVHHGTVMDIQIVQRRIETDPSRSALVEAVIEAREEAVIEPVGRSGLELERVLAFEGHLSLALTPKEFRAAVMENPGLASGALARFFPEAVVPQIESTALKGKAKSDKTFRYLLPESGAGDTNGLKLLSVLFKDHLKDDYSLENLLVDRKTPAASILQFVSDLTDGEFQPVAAFPGLVEGFLTAGPARQRKAQTAGKPISDPLGKTLAVLLDLALVRQGFLADDPDAPADRGLNWLATVLKGRSIVALESDLPFCERTIARLVASKVSLPLVVPEAVSTPELVLNLGAQKQQSLIVLSMLTYPRLVDPDFSAHELLSGDHAALIGCSTIQSLPASLRNSIETTITLPKPSQEVFQRLFAAIFGVKPPDSVGASAVWVRYVQPSDFARIARVEQDPKRAFFMLRHRIEDRLRRLTPSHGPSLQDLHGLGEARVRAEMIISDVKAAVAGEIHWADVDRGMLLTGPPGCGKTALARAIARGCGIHFLEASAARWQSAGYLNDHLAAMARDFREARRFEPTIMFIDEIDSIGNRDNFSGSNAIYQTEVVNALLAELQGFSDRGKVIVIAATNNAENVDPAIKRAGRLDRVIEVTLPTIDALEEIFSYYLAENHVNPGPGADIVLRPLAEAAFGRTGADVSLAVRGALRRARVAGRPLCQDDLLAELFGRPISTEMMRPLSGEGMRRVAIHEAGHAVVRLKSGDSLSRISYISIVPRADGSLGFVALRPDLDSSTLSRSDYLSYLEILLGGRAAEEVFYGANGVGAGAGGSESSDLAKATEIATDMVCRLGLGRSSRLFYHKTPTADDLIEAEELIADCYARAKEMLEKDRSIVEKIVSALIERQEMTGEELRRLIGENFSDAARPACGSKR